MHVPSIISITIGYEIVAPQVVPSRISFLTLTLLTKVFFDLPGLHEALGESTLWSDFLAATAQKKGCVKSQSCRI